MIRQAIVLTVLIACLPACPAPESRDEIYLHQVTPKPIAMTAEVEHPTEESGLPRTIRISEGGVLGLGCTEYCEENPRAQCAATSVRFSESGIAEVRDVFLLSGANGSRVLIGKQPGTVTLEVSSPCVSATYRVFVEARN